MLKAILATGNSDKIIEIAAILRDVELLPRPSHLGDVDEAGDTLEDNARLKAIAVVEATGTLTIADDTGLEVDFLGGLPGVRTSRFAGENATYDDNIKKILAELEGIEVPRRTARFRTVAIACFPNGTEILTQGVLHGSIALAASGYGGFGYDPVFIPDETPGRTLAELSFEDKNSISHRGLAFRALAQRLKDY